MAINAIPLWDSEAEENITPRTKFPEADATIGNAAALWITPEKLENFPATTRSRREFYAQRVGLGAKVNKRCPI